MTASIIDGKLHAVALRARLTEETARYKTAHGLVPGLATVLVGDDPASEVYVRNKNKTAEAIGFKSVHRHLPGTASEAEVLAEVRALNADKAVHGILVQLPLPKQIREEAVLDTLDPAKDVDALTPTNAGLLLSGRAKLVSCTPAGVMILLKETLGEIVGMDALVIGRSLLFGKPAAQLLLAANATVTMAHSKTRDLPALARRADILVAAIGRPLFVKGDWVKPGATVIDVGINRVDAGGGKTKLVGDVDYDEALKTAGHITPVPGGVGAMTIICLMRNTLIAAASQLGLPAPKI
ncbi:MAG: bifunctional methylenetetrahydrofolate dehydrogenase/methenyltetrahydrofolate cyclohydrolase FolD [Alphaproteobacteria bacterium]|nr:bifunctional methylenetetrahydrofolate dehydrogenase/methenyltetrahydrofolate cyclohydrolase FolD [Alphaproteobacteria bacterium]MDE1986103.1 bifunctional methylenetetrahydrofolate dehydrogenase/methenyltetrahydrofolate cyclohydrolase FolD [Alphaproteobacteria bacterium]MDE2264433.1 bifunctional methylenetetrahydrofolate dehydrogenase/methenyltetrahydrofolate cyclohydrolase FolD [Alphaproteobacteria bacterium]MDE2499214.1 bifunctional methylenetetrahydrofolate dehydrogenase/methenyltetrahydro